uniref:Uncharacterized protein n=1 Tax=Candidatus Kentrum sp. FW TaxID=2126338 RepID=A0A450SL64_9GAMM|nr:MAG: hypothetical protein BECKFW1821A_GA0114235_104713 [Candidatus Kentron sp. FW]
MKWRAFTYQGKTYDLSHLDPFIWSYAAIANGERPGYSYKFQVRFSLHCFTREPSPEQRITKDLLYRGPKETRVFCFERYELSCRLPAIICTLEHRECYRTPRGNLFVIEPIVREEKEEEYEVYFQIPKTTISGRGKKRLNLIVQSAYLRREGYGTTQPRKELVSLNEIARKKLRRK